MKKTGFAHLTVLAFFLSLLLTGCVFTPRMGHAIREYDLKTANTVYEQDFFQIQIFHNNTPSRTRMLFRNANNHIIQDDCNVGVQLPEQMLQRYFSLMFPAATPSQKSAPANLRCALNIFEFDLASSEAILEFSYVLHDAQGKHPGRVLIREKFTSTQPDDLVRAMNQAAERAGAELWQQISKFKPSNK